MTEEKMRYLQERIGYRFENKDLLWQALSHSSYANEHKQEHRKDNERLEFLGDAVLELASSEFLFLEYPDLPEGDMTKLRASIVCEPTLALCAREIDLPDYLLLGKGEEHTGGRQRNSIVSDALEALIGAIYLDGSFANAKEFVRKFILTDIEHKKLFYDSKTILQEIVQGEYRDDRRDGGTVVCFIPCTAGEGGCPAGDTGRQDCSVRPVCGFFRCLSGRRAADGN